MLRMHNPEGTQRATSVNEQLSRLRNHRPTEVQYNNTDSS